MNDKKKINYLNDIFYPFSVILMESFWLFPWLMWIGLWPYFGEQDPALSLVSLIIVLVVSLVLTRIITRQNWPIWLIRTVIIGAGVITLLIVLRIEYNGGYGIFNTGWWGFAGDKLAHFFDNPHPIVVAIIAVIYLWWRGIGLGRSTSQFRNIYTSFLKGIVFTIVLIILWRLTSGEDTFEKPGGEIALYVIGFFFFSLVSIAIGHLYVMHRSMPKEEAALTSGWRWVPMMVGVIGGMMVIGFVIAIAFSEDMFQVLRTGFRYVSDAAGQVIEWLSVPLNWIMEIIVKFISWIVGMLRTESGQTGNVSGGGPFEDIEVKGFDFPPEAAAAIKWIIIALVVGVIIFFLARAISRFWTSRAGDRIEEIHESIWDADEIRNDFRKFFKNLGNLFRRKPQTGTGYHFDTGAGKKMDMREIYRHLLWEGKNSGIPRRKHETVTEYARRLEKTLPEGTEPVDTITDLYTDVRYGDIGIQEEKVDNANTLWDTLRNMLRGLRGAG
jgi:hypothetical protein